MSGNYGWGGRDRSDDYSSTSGSVGGFSSARTPYAGGSHNYGGAAAPNPSLGQASLRMTRVPGVAVDLSPRKHIKTTKDNVLLVSLDRTGSLNAWHAEIVQRLALLYKEAQKYLGDSLEIVFMGYGDAQLCGDKFEVAPTGSGQELDGYITALDTPANGGGNSIESAELPAYYVANQIDTTDAKSVFFFTITDEGFYPEVCRADVDAVLGLRSPQEAINSAGVFRSLKPRMNTYVIMARTGSQYPTQERVIDAQWKDALGDDCFVPLDDSRRVVDVMLGVIAKVRGQFAQFSQDLNKRQGGTAYGNVNISTVQQSISMVTGAPSAPSVKAGTQSLLNAGVAAPSLTGTQAIKPGTRSLLRDDK